ncbi:hypothetical protein GCM10017781_20000 [Deinococcus metalli]|nr:hypothetical protein GCM10017781_20000 [Deinococcus metalli]
MTGMQGGISLRAERVTRQFGGVTALRDVSVDVPPGQRHAVIGPNGAGKSTLFRVISGEHRPSAGRVTLDGRVVSGLPPERIAALGVARSFQTSSVFDEETVRHNVILALLAHTPRRRKLWQPLAGQGDLAERADDVLARVNLLGAAPRRAGELPHGARRQLELAMVLAQSPRLLLLDEPLAGLDGHERGEVMALLHSLPRDVTTVLIEHDLAFCLEFADHVTVLSNGEVIATGPPEHIRADAAVQAAYVGAARGADRPAASPVAARPPVLDVQDLHAAYGSASALSGVSLDVRPGEVVAVLGRNGMGKTTLLTTLMGWRRPTGGHVRLEGQDVTGLPPAALAARGLALVPQGRRMLPGLTVAEELSVAARPGPWTPERVYGVFPRLRERQRSASTTLSGGEQQLVAIGRALMQNPRVLLLDEPSEGLSPAMVSALREVLQSLRAGGETIVLAEQHLDLALAVADRVYVLEHGTVAFEGDAAQFAGDRAMIQALLGV